MPRAKKTAEKKPLRFRPKPHHERILGAVYTYHFLTVEQVTRLFYSKTSIADVRKQLHALEKAGYLLSLYLPRPTPFGSVPKIYALDRKGINFLKAQGYDVHGRFRPSEEEEKSYLFLRHPLAVNDFLISAASLQKQYPTIAVHELMHERTLKRQEPIKVSFEKLTGEGKPVLDKFAVPVTETVRLIPDGFVDIRIQQPDEKTARCCILLELDRATIEEKSFKKKIRALLTFVKGGDCLRRFHTKYPTVAIANSVGGVKRREQLRAWTEQELKKSKEPHFWTDMFVFTNLPEQIDSKTLFLSPVWYTPFSNEPTVLLRTGHNRASVPKL